MPPVVATALKHRRLTTAVWAAMFAAVVIGSIAPGGAPPGGFGMDKIVHALAYTALTAIPVTLAAGRRRLAIALGILAVASLLEIAQGIVPSGRAASLADAVANGIGVLAGCRLGTRLRSITGTGGRAVNPH